MRQEGAELMKIAEKGQKLETVRRGRMEQKKKRRLIRQGGEGTGGEKEGDGSKVRSSTPQSSARQ